VKQREDLVGSWLEVKAFVQVMVVVCFGLWEEVLWLIVEFLVVMKDVG
jgi:hypothetical protein